MSRGVALVTGARGAVGRALVRRLIDSGHDVVAHSRGALTELPDGVRSLTGDLADPGVCEAIARDVGEVTLLVNNAADQSVVGFDALNAQDWGAMMNATFMSAVLLTQALRPAMPSGASVVNISSIEASSAFPDHAHYAAAKAALESFTRSAALELAGRGIRVNAVAPGLIDRPGLAQDWPEGVAWWNRTCPLGRPVTPDEVADAVLLLAEAGGVSGVVLPVDGGWSASARLA